MTNDTRKLWAVRLEDGQRFLDRHMMALGGGDLGDLSRLADSKEAFRAAVEAVRPGEASRTATLCYRLAYEIHTGDYVALITGEKIWLGVVEGDYVWDPAAAGCEHQRPVRWDKGLPMDEFSRAALREVSSSPLPLAAVQGTGEQFLSAFHLPPLSTERPVRRAAPAAVPASAPMRAAEPAAEGKETRTLWKEEPPDRTAEPAEPVPPRQGGWTAKPAAPAPLHPIPDDLVPKAIADPRRFLVEDWRRKLDGDTLREFTASLLTAMNYVVEASADRPGVDLVAARDELTPLLLVQVHFGVLTAADVERLAASLETGECGVIFTLTDLTPETREKVKSLPWVRCVDGMEMAGLVLKYYGKLDGKFQRLIPLRMGYVPAT